MIAETKDSIANVVTMAAAGSAMVNWNGLLTMGLIVTGIVLNIVRIMAIRKKDKKKE